MMDAIELVRAASQVDEYHKVREPLIPDAQPVLFRKASLPLKQHIEIPGLLLVVEKD